VLVKVAARLASATSDCCVRCHNRYSLHTTCKNNVLTCKSDLDKTLLVLRRRLFPAHSQCSTLQLLHKLYQMFDSEDRHIHSLASWRSLPTNSRKFNFIYNPQFIAEAQFEAVTATLSPTSLLPPFFASPMLFLGGYSGFMSLKKETVCG